MPRIVTTALFSSASIRGVAVHGSLSQGMWSAMSCFSFDGIPPFAASEQFSPVFALVASQPAKPCSWMKRLSETMDPARCAVASDFVAGIVGIHVQLVDVQGDPSTP